MEIYEFLFFNAKSHRNYQFVLKTIISRFYEISETSPLKKKQLNLQKILNFYTLLIKFQDL